MIALGWLMKRARWFMNTKIWAPMSYEYYR